MSLGYAFAGSIVVQFHIEVASFEVSKSGRSDGERLQDNVVEGADKDEGFASLYKEWTKLVDKGACSMHCCMHLDKLTRLWCACVFSPFPKGIGETRTAYRRHAASHNLLQVALTCVGLRCCLRIFSTMT